MNMMKRLLGSVNNVWNTQAKERNIFRLRKGNGQHTRMTIHSGQLHLHSSPYHVTLPVKQTVVLDDLTIDELIPILVGMGYVVEVLPGAQAYLSEGAVILMSDKDISITDGCVVTAFTSNVWRVMYPLARLLELVEGDVDLAVQQMYLRSSKSKWLDYWASFFDVKRFIGESDIELVKRIVLFLVNPKTNNRSIEELMKIVLGVDVEIIDVAPAIFDVRLEADAMTVREDTDNLLRKIKAGGVWYVYNYYKTYTEDYDSYLRDATGQSLRELDGGAPSGDVEMGLIENHDIQTEVMDVVEWLIEYPVEIFEDVLSELTMHAEIPHIERGYRQVKQLLDEYNELSTEYHEARYRLQTEGGTNHLWLEMTSEVRLIEEAIHAKIQEEMLPTITEVLFAERIKAPVENSYELSLGFVEERYLYARLGGFILNIHTFGGDDLIAPIMRVTESIRMVMTDSNGEVVKSLTQ